ncbi:MAG: tetratricopeptide repeat protein [Deltaproteobacteria bacterium]|nr:tetratricopeptide repeat protein [Deltaproteobacteria bacterium]
MKRFVLNAVMILVAVVTGATTPGCHRSLRVINPDHFRNEVIVPQQDTTFGNPWSYAHKLRGDILLARGDTEAAVNEYQMAATGEPSDAWIQLQLADALLAANDLERAQVHIAKAILLNPGNARGWTNAAELYDRLGDSRKAFEAASYGAQVDRTDTTALLWMGNRLAMSSHPAKRQAALEKFQLALVRCQTDPALYLATGRIALKLSYIDLALRYLHQYLNMYGDDTDAVVEAAEKLAAANYPTAAIHLYETMLQRHPTADPMRTNLVPLYLKNRQYDKVIQTVMGFFQMATSPEQVTERSDWLLKADAPWEARQLILDTFSGAPAHPYIRFKLAQIEWALRRDEVALELLNFPGDVPDDLTSQVDMLQREIIGSTKK